jgi:hypothetical protein
MGSSRTRQKASAARELGELLAVESLEPRQAMAADVAVSLVDGLLRIKGTPRDDVILLRQAGDQLTIDYASGVNTIKQIVVPSGVQSIFISGGLGQDLIVLRLGSLAGVTRASGGGGVDQVIFRRPVLIDDGTTQDVLVPLLDPSLPQDSTATFRRSEGPDAVHLAMYSGQMLASLQTWTADSRRVDTTLDGVGNLIRETFVADECRLSEIWTSQGGYRRTVTQPNGDILQETFATGELRLQEIRRGSDVTRTVWDAEGCTLRQTIQSGTVLLEEAWDAKQGYRRSWTGPNGTTQEEAYEAGVLRLSISKTGDREVRNAWDATGTRVREVHVGSTLIRLDQWESATKRRVTLFGQGKPETRETFEAGRCVLKESWTGGLFTRTAWNDAGDRLTQTLQGEALVREEQVKLSGETQVTEWRGDVKVRTTIDTAGNASIERFSFDTLRSRRLRPAAGGVLLTVFDPATGKPANESRSSGDGTQTQTTTWSDAMVVRRTLRNGILTVREVWKDGGLSRTTRDDAGIVKREVFSGSDRESLAEGTKVSETVTAANGDELQTTWYDDGSRLTLGLRDGVAVMLEQVAGDTRHVIVQGPSGGQQETYIGNRLVEQSFALEDGTVQTRRFTDGRLTYEYCADSSGRSQKTTWAEEYTGDASLTGMGLVIRRLVADGNRRLREVEYRSSVQRTLWNGSGDTPGSTYYHEEEFLTNAFGMPLRSADMRREIRFYDAGTLVYHARIRVDGQGTELVNKPSAAWTAMQAGRFGLTSSNDIFALSATGGTFNLGGVVGYIIGTWKGENPDNPISIDLNPISGILSGIQTTFADIGHALDVNFRTLQNDIWKSVGSINFDWLSLPSLDGVKFDHPNFAKIIDLKWQPFQGTWSGVSGGSFASIDISLPWNTPEEFGRWASEKWKTASDWLAARDVISKAIVAISPPNVDFLNDRTERYRELGYSYTQARLLLQLLDSSPPAFQGVYLSDYERFLAEEGQKIYQGYYGGNGDLLDAADHASLQQSAGHNALERLLKKYGLNPDGSLNRGDVYSIPDGFSLASGSATVNGPTGDLPEDWGAPITPRPKDPPKKKERDKPTVDMPPDPPPPEDSEANKRQRQEATRERIKAQFRRKLAEAAAKPVDAYSKGKGREVATFYDAVEQTLKIGGAFGVGFAEGAVTTVEGLAKGITAALDSDTWKNLGTSIRRNGRDFMNASDKARVIADFGRDACRKLEEGAVAMIAEWERAGPEGRARMIGTLSGQVATDAVLTALGSRIAKAAGDAATLGRKTKAAADKVAETAEYTTLETRAKARVGDKINAADGQARVRSAMDDLLREDMRRKIRDEAGMDPEHARRLAEFSRQKEMLIVVRGSNPKSLQYHGRSGYAAKPGDLKLKTSTQSGLVTASRRADGALIDARGTAVDGYTVRSDGWIAGPTGARSNYRLDSRGHVVDAKGTKFYSDYDILSVDEAPYPDGNTWIMVPTGDATTGPGRVIAEMNEALLGPNRKGNIVMHGANRENIGKTAGGIYQIMTPDIGDTFVVADYDGTIHHLNQAEVKDFLKQRNIPWENDGL